ncbi:hypothetical protein [Algoriphagus sp. CAU 1675]|uniref:hypothetical protein n=1 Tax=Algoriphagus sp. CAU 1675 TaxID=3032597 RepID=UPI0023DCA134|nr:hypothetical protein [Algoriphagus sp. CAU 1675]MDF2156236.1 hypothetical protein [Algoriphagus sp. CAU 1675]
MKKGLYIVLILLGISFRAWSQESAVSFESLAFETSVEKQFWQTGTSENNPLALFMAVHAEAENQAENWHDLLSTLDEQFEKKGRSENFLRVLFQKSHQNLFKKYEQHSSFNDMLNEGLFDCVSGSAALGMLLERYGFEYDIVETDYHVFIVANSDNKKIILESTVKIGGMISTPSEVQNYLDSYQPAKKETYLELRQRIGAPKVDFSENSIFRKVDLNQLAGLQYYNDAILHFNQQRFREAAWQLEKAFQLYPSERIEGLKELAIDQAYKTYGTDISQ